MVVAGQEQDIDERWGYSPAKLKTKCEALGIALVTKPLAGSMARTYRVRLMQWLRWWQARSKRLM